MKRFHDFRICVSTYYSQERNNLFPDLWECSNKNCTYSKRLWRNGFYERNAICFFNIYRIVIQRYRCPLCNTTVSLLPTFLFPGYQYTAFVIFLCLKLIYMSKWPMEKTASYVDSGYLSYQHIAFYKKRLLRNFRFCIPVCSQIGITLPSETSISFWLKKVETMGGLEYFNSHFYKHWDGSVLDKLN